MLLYLLSIRPKEWQRRCWSQVEEATSGVTVWWSSLKQATSQSWWITSVTLCEVSSPIKSFYWENYWKNCRVYLTGNWFGLIKIELNWKVISVILRPSVSVYVCVCIHCVLDWGEGNVPESIRRIEKLLKTSIEFHELDLLDRPGLEKLFKKVRKLLHLVCFS